MPPGTTFWRYSPCAITPSCFVPTVKPAGPGWEAKRNCGSSTAPLWRWGRNWTSRYAPRETFIFWSRRMSFTGISFWTPKGLRIVMSLFHFISRPPMRCSMNFPIWGKRIAIRWSFGTPISWQTGVTALTLCPRDFSPPSWKTPPRSWRVWCTARPMSYTGKSCPKSCRTELIWSCPALSCESMM